MPDILEEASNMLDDQVHNRGSCPSGDGDLAKDPITIVMVDDHPVVRCGLRGLLEMERDLHVIADVSGRTEAIAVVVAQRPAILLLDIELSDGHCFPIVDELAWRCPETRVILHSGQVNEAYLLMARSKPSCKGILDKANPDEVIVAIRAVASGSKYYDRKAKLLLGRLSLLESLTPREIEVLVLIASDYSARMAATELGITVRCVEAHVEKIKKKLGLHTNVALTNFAHQVGLLKIA